jgi:hypothetical protein
MSGPPWNPGSEQEAGAAADEIVLSDRTNSYAGRKSGRKTPSLQRARGPQGRRMGRAGPVGMDFALHLRRKFLFIKVRSHRGGRVARAKINLSLQALIEMPDD